MLKLLTAVTALCLFSACASTDRGKAIQQTAVGATLATSGTVSLAVVAVGGGIGIAQASESTLSRQAFEIVAPGYVMGAIVGAAFLGVGAALLGTAVGQLDAPPPTQVIESRPAAPSKVEPKPKAKVVSVGTTNGIMTAKVAATLVPRDRLVSSSFFVSGDPKHLRDAAQVVWSVDIRSSAWRFKDCAAAPFVDGAPVASATTSYGGKEDGAGVVERFVITLDRKTARAVADADDAELRICEEVFILDAASRQRLTELLAL